jgi:cell division ATPase FtsA
MEAIIIHPQNKEQASLFEQLAKTLKVPFEKAKKQKSSYNEAFEKKMKMAEEDKKAGRYKAIKTTDLWK